MRDNPNVPPKWAAPEGTAHRFCPGCEHWFASRGPGRCPTCVSSAGRKKFNHHASSTFDTPAGGFPGVSRSGEDE